MPTRIESRTSLPVTSTSATDRTPAPSQPAARASVTAPDAFDNSARGPSVGDTTGDFRALVRALSPELKAASGYEAHFGQNRKSAAAQVEGGGNVSLPTGNGRGPSFLAEAGKPLTVTYDASRVFESTEKVELVWRVAPKGEEQVIPLTDGTKDPNTGKLVVKPGVINVPEDASGVIRLCFRTHSGGRVSNNWDPSNDAAIASREGATLVFGDDWKTQQSGPILAGDTLRIAYDRDRISELFGGSPDHVTACVSFNGEPPMEIPLTMENGTFLPSVRVPFEAHQVSIWFKGQSGDNAAYDSSFGHNFKFEVAPARDDADPSWKNEMLRSTSFPNLKAENFVGIGPSSQRYNCIAWTLGIRDEWVWPGTKVADFDKLYGDHGYRPLDTLDLSHDPAMEKIVVYGLQPRSAHGEIEVTHGARMDEQGRLTSKIGTQPLIRHNNASDLSGPSYGEPIRVYVRPREVVS